MKKLFVNFMLVAVAAMAFTACQNEIDGGVVKNEENTVTMNFVADAPESRTSVEIEGTTATFSWAEEDETFTFVQNTTEGLKKGTNVSFTNNAGLAKISATFTEATSPIVAVYPANAWVSNENTNFNRAKISVPTDQTITDGTFDPNADLLVSKVVTPENATDTYMLQFARLVAVAKMTIKNLPVVGNETIEKVNFSIDGENALTGRLYIDLATAEVSEWGYYGQNFNNVNLTGNVAATTANDIYFTCMPTTIASGDTFTLEVKTDVAVYTRTVTIPEDSAIEFNSGRVVTFGVNMADAKRVVITGIALPWSENFDSEDLSKYDITNGGGTTKVYNESLAGGSAGEILIAKGGGSMTATIASDGQAKTLYLTFKSNKDFISVSSETSGVTIVENSATNYNITLDNGVYTFKVTLTNSNTGSNARVDDILLTAEAPTVKSIVAEGMKTSFTVGDDFEFNGTVKANYTDGSSIDVTEDVTIDNSSVNMGEVGTYSVKISYNEFSTTYDITVSAASAGGETTVKLSCLFADNSASGWTNSYAAHTFTYDCAEIAFSAASKQTTTISDMPVTKNGTVDVVMTNSATISSVTFKCKQWGSKAQTMKLYYSTDGSTYSEYTTGVTWSDYTLTCTNLPANTTAVRAKGTSSSNQIGIESVTITYNN